MGRADSNGRFAKEVRGELKSRGWGVRTLARRMNPEAPETARRSLNRWLSVKSPTTPSRANRVAVAVALGLPEKHFDGDEDEDESEQELAQALLVVARLLRDQVRGEVAA